MNCPQWCHSVASSCIVDTVGKAVHCSCMALAMYSLKTNYQNSHRHHLLHSTPFSYSSKPGDLITHNAFYPLSDITEVNLSDYMQLPLEPQKTSYYFLTSAVVLYMYLVTFHYLVTGLWETKFKRHFLFVFLLLKSCHHQYHSGSTNHTKEHLCNSHITVIHPDAIQIHFSHLNIIMIKQQAALTRTSLSSLISCWLSTVLYNEGKN